MAGLHNARSSDNTVAGMLRRLTAHATAELNETPWSRGLAAMSVQWPPQCCSYTLQLEC